MKSAKYFLLLLCLLFIGAAYPKPAGYVADYANILNPNTEQTIHSLAYELEQKSGAQLAVVTVKTLNGSAIDDFSWQLFEQWGIGEKGKDTGVLLLIAPQERKLRIEVGYGFEGAIPDGVAGEIIRNDIVPYFKQGNMDQGVLRGSIVLLQLMAKEMNVTLSGNYSVPKRVEAKPSLLGNLLYLLFIFLFLSGRFFFFPFFLGGFGRGYYSRGGGGFGGFGGFGGGLSGGGGASGSW